MIGTGSRVSKLLKDARATLARPDRPTTPRHLNTRASFRVQPLRRLSSGVECTSTQSNSLINILCSSLEQCTDAGKTGTLLLDLLREVELGLGDEQRIDSIIRICKEITCASNDTSNIIRAANILLRTHAAFDACEVLEKVCNAKNGSDALRSERIFDPLLRQLSDPQLPLVNRSSILAIIRVASAGGVDLRNHLFTLGLLPAMNQVLSFDPLPTFLLIPTLSILRHFAKDFLPTLLKMGILEKLLDRLKTRSEEYAKEIDASILRLISQVASADEGAAWFRGTPPCLNILLEIAKSLNCRDLSSLSSFCFLANTFNEGGTNSEGILTLVLTDTTFLPSVLHFVEVCEERVPPEMIHLLLFLANQSLRREVALVMLQSCALQKAVTFLSPRDAGTDAFFILACLMWVSNLSFFLHECNPFLFSVKGLCPILLALLLSNDSVEGTVEASRIFGNLSSLATAKEWIESNRADEVFVLLALHPDPRIAYNNLGILLNLTANRESRILCDSELRKQLVQVVHETRLEWMDEDAQEIEHLQNLVQKNIQVQCA